MSDKYILINKAQATTTLKNLADSQEGMFCLRIAEADVAAAETELATIDNDYWLSSDTHTVVEGNTTEGILLPKKAINA